MVHDNKTQSRYIDKSNRFLLVFLLLTMTLDLIIWDKVKPKIKSWA